MHVREAPKGKAYIVYQKNNCQTENSSQNRKYLNMKEPDFFRDKEKIMNKKLNDKKYYH